MADAMPVGSQTIDGVRVRCAESTGPSAYRDDLLSPRAMGEILVRLVAEWGLKKPHVVAPGHLALLPPCSRSRHALAFCRAGGGKRRGGRPDSAQDRGRDVTSNQRR
jgi:hypothetical protein